VPWAQPSDPLGNLPLSALVASLPVLFLFLALGVAKMRGYAAAAIATGLAMAVAVLAQGMPPAFAAGAALYGALFGLWPIGWIVAMAVFLYNLTQETGQFAVLSDSIAAFTDDRRLQALLIAFSFGAFLESAAGYGTPVAITAAMLAGLGFTPFYAAAICLVANTVPVAWGGIGLPMVTASAVTGIDPMVISRMVGRQVPVLSLLVPFWLVFLMAGWRGTKEVLPAIAVVAVSFAGTQWFAANYVSPLLPGVLSSLASIAALALFLRVWKPKAPWRFPEESPATLRTRAHTPGAVLKAWSPFLILTILVTDWGLSPVKALLDAVTVPFPFPGMDRGILADGKPLRVAFALNWLASPGTAILIAAAISAAVLRVSPGRFLRILGKTLSDLRVALLTVSLIMAFAFVANWSGETAVIGRAFTVTGWFFPFLSPVIGWLGVFVTGSDTSSNALFGNLQKVTAEGMGINPVLTVAANCSGGVAGKMISPQSIVVGCSSTGLVGREAELFRFTLKHSVLFTLLVALIAAAQAYLVPWMIPEPVAAGEAVSTASGWGPAILGASFAAVLVLAVAASRSARQAR